MTDLCPPIDPTVQVDLTYTDPDTDLTTTLTIPPNLTGEPDTPWFWNALTWPLFDYVYTYAPTSRWLPGQVLLSAVPGGASIPLSVVVQDKAGQVALQTKRALLDTALAATDLVVTYKVDGVTVGTWPADPSKINWGPVDTQALGMFIMQGQAAVPLNGTGEV